MLDIRSGTLAGNIFSRTELKSNIEILKNSGKGGVIVSRMPPENFKSIGAGIAE